MLLTSAPADVFVANVDVPFPLEIHSPVSPFSNDIGCPGDVAVGRTLSLPGVQYTIGPPRITDISASIGSADVLLGGLMPAAISDVVAAESEFNVMGAYMYPVAWIAAMV
jgi:hypothetical protein